MEEKEKNQMENRKFIIQYSQQFRSLRRYWSFERIHASNVLQSFFHTCKVFYMKSFDYTSIHLIEIKK